jgi:hypothetical protein
MRYLLLIQKDETAWRKLSDDERAAFTARYSAFGARMKEAGILRSGAILEPAETATTVRVREGKRLVTDGPFAETSEQVAGVAVIEVADLDEAMRWAAGHPDAAWGSVEVRPVRWDTA